MSRNIPKVRRWGVRYYDGRTMLAYIVVDAPNKMFARWNARDDMLTHWPNRYIAATRITVTLERNQGHVPISEI